MLNPRDLLAFACALAVGVMACACSQDVQRKKKEKKDAAAEGGSDTPSEGDDAKPSDDGTDPDLEQMLKDCGANGIADKGPDEVIYQKHFTSLPIVRQILIIKVTIASSLDVKVTGSQTTQDAKVTVASVEGLFSGLAKSEADKQAAAATGVTTFTNIPPADYGDLSQHKIYDGVYCTIVPATKVDNRRGGKKTLVTFDPPLPSSISPRAVAGRYEKELGAKKVFSGIKATITESDNPDLAGAKEITGDVTVTKVDSTAQVDDGKGGKTTLKADVAYQVTYGFKDAKTTFALGLPPSVTYFIDYQKHDMTGDVVDTSAAGGGLAVFLPQ